MEKHTKIILIVIFSILLLAFLTMSGAESLIIFTIIVNLLIFTNQIIRIDSIEFNDSTNQQENEQFQNTVDVDDYKYSIDNDYYNIVENQYDPSVELIREGVEDMGNDIDSRMLMDGRMRQKRDKEMIDSRILKDADYYRHHYDEELETNENKVWWEREQPFVPNFM